MLGTAVAEGAGATLTNVKAQRGCTPAGVAAVTGSDAALVTLTSESLRLCINGLADSLLTQSFSAAGSSV